MAFEFIENNGDTGCFCFSKVAGQDSELLRGRRRARARARLLTAQSSSASQAKTRKSKTQKIHYH